MITDEAMITESWAVDALLSLCVASAWVACFGFLSKRGEFDMRHYPGFIASTTGTTLVLAGLIAEGLTVRVGKLVLLDGLAMVAAFVMSHALARSAPRRVRRPVDVPMRRPD